MKRTRDDVVRFGGEQETFQFLGQEAHKEQPKPEKHVPGKHDEEKPDFSKKENREESGSGKKKGADMHFASAPMGGDAGGGGPPGAGGGGDSSGKNGFPAKGSDGDGDGKKGEGKDKPSKKDWKTDGDGMASPSP